MHKINKIPGCLYQLQYLFIGTLKDSQAIGYYKRMYRIMRCKIKYNVQITNLFERRYNYKLIFGN